LLDQLIFFLFCGARCFLLAHCDVDLVTKMV
jgi:hypothetical protein